MKQNERDEKFGEIVYIGLLFGSGHIFILLVAP